MVDSSQSTFAVKGAQLLQKGDAALKGSFFGNLMKGRAERCDEAKEFYG